MHILMNGMRYICECIGKVRSRIMCRWIWRKLDGYFASLRVALKKELKLSGQLKTFILYYRRCRRHQIVCKKQICWWIYIVPWNCRIFGFICPLFRLGDYLRVPIFPIIISCPFLD